MPDVFNEHLTLAFSTYRCDLSLVWILSGLAAEICCCLRIAFLRTAELVEGLGPELLRIRRAFLGFGLFDQLELSVSLEDDAARLAKLSVTDWALVAGCDPLTPGNFQVAIRASNRGVFASFAPLLSR